MKITAPVRIARIGDTHLRIEWNDGSRDDFSVVALRQACPCAACVNEWTGEKLLDPKSIPADVKPVKIVSVGRYAMGIHWSDRHTTGIFAYDYLKNLTVK